MSTKGKISGWRYQNASATSVSTFCGSGWSPVGLSLQGYLFDSDTVDLPALLLAAGSRFSGDPLLLFVHTGRGGKRYRAAFSGSYRLPIVLRYTAEVTVHRARRPRNRNPASDGEDQEKNDRFHETKENPPILFQPSLSLRREFRTCIRDDAPAHGSGPGNNPVLLCIMITGNVDRNSSKPQRVSKLR